MDRGIDPFLAAAATAAEDQPGATGAGKPSSKQAKGPFVMSPGVIVEPAAARLYMMNPQGGIDAVQFDTGKLLWTTPAGAKPLALFDRRLVAQAEQTRSHSLSIVFLDTNRNGQLDSSVAVPAPSSVVPSISNGPGSSSSVDGRVVADGLLIWWTVTRRELSGMPRPVRVKSDSGAALINLKTREVTTLTPEQASAKLRGSVVPLKAPRLTGTERLYFPPQGADGFLVSVQLGPASAGQRAVLKRWSAETGEPLADVDLGPGYAASSISADGSLFLIVRAAGSSDSGGPGYVWSIYGIASGQRLAEV